MKTRLVSYLAYHNLLEDRRHRVELMADPISPEQARAHVNLGGSVMALRDGAFYGRITTDCGLYGLDALDMWTNVQWHVLVREL